MKITYLSRGFDVEPVAYFSVDLGVMGDGVSVFAGDIIVRMGLPVININEERELTEQEIEAAMQQIEDVMLYRIKQ